MHRSMLGSKFPKFAHHVGKFAKKIFFSRPRHSNLTSPVTPIAPSRPHYPRFACVLVSVLCAFSVRRQRKTKKSKKKKTQSDQSSGKEEKKTHRKNTKENFPLVDVRCPEHFCWQILFDSTIQRPYGGRTESSQSILYQKKKRRRELSLKGPRKIAKSKPKIRETREQSSRHKGSRKNSIGVESQWVDLQLGQFEAPKTSRNMRRNRGKPAHTEQFGVCENFFLFFFIFSHLDYRFVGGEPEMKFFVWTRGIRHMGHFEFKWSFDRG